LEIFDGSLGDSPFEIVDIGVALGIPTWWVVNISTIPSGVKRCLVINGFSKAVGFELPK
jgi:hypothetical protein